MKQMFTKMDFFMILKMQKYGIPLLRICLGIVFLWFGLLKVFSVSPVADMIKATYSSFPYPAFLIFLGIWEAVIGIGLIFKIYLRATLALLWLQMAGTFAALLLLPAMFFTNGNVLLLTTYGEFVVKNIVLAAAGIAIGGHEVKHRADL